MSAAATAAIGQRRRWIAERAYRCVRWLQAQGLEVMYIEKTERQPRITIFPGPLCDKIEGAVSVYERIQHNGTRIERRYKKADRLDCEVRWAESEASHAQ